ncbi:hypothetical protein RyT2_11450 [Pseudolactococcus yaeyamensis]
MSLKRELLTELGIEDKTVIDKIMQAHGADVEKNKSLSAENDSLKTQLAEQTAEIELFKKSDEQSAETKKALEDLQGKFETLKTEKDAELAQLQKNNAVALALKDTGTLDSDLLFGQLNLEKIVIQDDGKVSGLDDQVASIKESKPFLFAQEKAPDPQQPSIFVGGNPAGDAGGKSSDPFQAIVDGYK